MILHFILSIVHEILKSECITCLCANLNALFLSFIIRNDGNSDTTGERSRRNDRMTCFLRHVCKAPLTILG